jgi:thiol-disulfide isomerase/thioredoxin
MNHFINFNKSGGISAINKNSGSLYSRIMNNGLKISTTSIFIIISIIILITLAIYYYYYVVRKFKTTYHANNEGKNINESLNGQDKQAELLFFYADWCPHCKTAKPVWEKLKEQYQNKMVRGYHIIFTEVNCTNETAETEQMMNKYNIEGFPTIKLLKDGQIIEFDAKPTSETLNEFLNTVL